MLCASKNVSTSVIVVAEGVAWCMGLFKYYRQAPREIYVKADAK